jgi:hypothetical protein
MICRLTRLECVKHTRLIYGQTHGILRILLLLAGASTGILVGPDILLLEWLRLLLRLLLLLLRLLIALISQTLATAGAPLFFLYSGNLGCSIPMIRPFLSSFVLVIRAIILPWSPGIAGVPLGLPLSL